MKKTSARFLSVLLTLCMLLTLLPTVALAATGERAIQLGTGGISGYDSTDGYDYIYCGTDRAEIAIKWRVLSTAGNGDSYKDASGDAYSGDSLFLLSNDLFGAFDIGDTYRLLGGVQFNYSGNSGNSWQNSIAQSWCKSFLERRMTAQEQAAVLKTTKSDAPYSNASITATASANILSGDGLFFLSAQEAETAAYGFTDDASRNKTYGDNADANTWWLRSPLSFYYLSDYVASVVGGATKENNVVQSWAARPAFNLNQSSVLFTSNALSGKVSYTVGADALRAVPEVSTNQWKLTLLDSDRAFSASRSGTGSVETGGSVTVNYTGAGTGTNEYVSALLVDGSGTVLYYGNVARSTASGTQEITIPSELAPGSYTLKLFSEQTNGAYKTDYASAFSDIPVTVTKPIIVPVTNITGVPARISAGSEAPLSLTGTVSPANATHQTITWSVKNGGSTNAVLGDNFLCTTYTGVVVLTATVANGLADGSDYTQDFEIVSENVYVGSTEVTIGYETAKNLYGGTVQYQDGVLTLTDVTVPNTVYKNNAAIYASDSLTMELAGTNTVTGPDTQNGSSFGVLGYGNLTIRGSGSLAALGGAAADYSDGIYVSGHAVTVSGGTVIATGGTAAASSGIYVTGNSVTVSGGVVNATGGTVTAESSQGHSDPVSAGLNFDVGTVEFSGGTITANGGNVTAHDADADSYGVYTIGDVCISKGTVIANGGNVTAQDADASSYGLYAYGDVSISAGTVTANSGTATATGTYLYNESSYYYDSYSSGLCSDTGSVTIGGGTVNVTAGAVSDKGDRGGSLGIYAYTDLTVSGGTVNATGGTAERYSGGLCADNGDLSVRNCELLARGNYEATYGSASFSVGTGMTVTGSTAADAAVDTLTAATIAKNTYNKFGAYVGSELAKTLRIVAASSNPGTGTGGGSGTASYTLSFNANGGSAISDVSKASGATVDLTAYAPTRSGYTFAGWYSDAALTKAVTSVKLTANTTVYAGWTKALPFTDVPEDAWYYGDVVYAYEHGLFAGTSDTTFSPNDPMTRQMLWTVLGRLDGQTLEGSGVFDAARTWAMGKGITDGSNPGSSITREQLVTILWRYAGSPKSTGDLSGFTDRNAVADYAEDAMAWAVEKGIVSGTSATTLTPDGPATRAQVAAILRRFAGIAQ